VECSTASSNGNDAEIWRRDIKPTAPIDRMFKEVNVTRGGGMDI
jgi:hypothetical protein